MEARPAMLHHMLSLCDGEIRLHVGRWTKNESTEEPFWASLTKPSWEVAKRKHSTHQQANFLEFHLYTDDELEDHRRLGFRRFWSSLKGNFWNQNFGTPLQTVKGDSVLLVGHFLDVCRHLINYILWLSCLYLAHLG